MTKSLTLLPFALLLVALQVKTPAQADPPDRSLSWIVQRAPVPFIPKVKIEVVVQEVEVDGIRFGFEAHIAFCVDHHPAEGSFVEFTSRDGNALRLQPVSGTVDWRTGGVVLTFTHVVDRAIGPEDIIVAVVQRSAAEPDCLIWDLAGTVVLSRALPPPFDVEGTISLSRSREECEPVDYGQLDAWVSIDTPLQAVQPLLPSNIVGFESRILLDRNQAAWGFLDIHLPGNVGQVEITPGGDRHAHHETRIRNRSVHRGHDRGSRACGQQALCGRLVLEHDGRGSGDRVVRTQSACA